MIKEGPGWRWGYDADAPVFLFLLGTEDWAVELTQAEFDDFRRLTQELTATLTAIAGELMDEEKICCEASSELIWLEVEGYPQAYGLRFILQQGRRAEGGWTPTAVPGLLNSLQAHLIST